MDLMEIIAAERDNMVPWKMFCPIHHKSPNLEIRFVNKLKKMTLTAHLVAEYTTYLWLFKY